MPHRDLYAAVDLGSNSFHLLVARREYDQLRVIDSLREMVRIGGGLDKNGQLDADTRSRAMECLSRFGQRLAGIPNHQIRAVGTQTFRRMRHPQQFLVVAETALGCPIDIIPGREEARLVWLGVSQGTGHQGEARLVIDIGGGSTEVAAGHGSSPVVVESLQYGCVSVTQRAFKDGQISKSHWRRMRDEIAGELEALKSDIRASDWQQAVGSSGTMRAVQRMVALRGDGLLRAFTLEDVKALRKQIIQAGHIDAVRIEGLSSSRQPVISGGILIIEACMRAFDIRHMDVSPFALREGLLYDLFGRLEHTDPREKTVAAMAHRHEADQSQAERVRDFALCAFEQIAESHGLSRMHRDLLDWTCQLHEVGLVIAHSHYQVHSAYIIEHSDMPGFSQQEQQYIACLLRYQRRKLQPDALDILPQRLQPSARCLLAILRLTVALCRGRSDADLPDFALQAIRTDAFEFALPTGWLEAHPLSARSLAFEQEQLKRIGLELKLAPLAEPHPHA